MHSRELLAADGWWGERVSFLLGCDLSCVAHVPVDSLLLMHTRAIPHWTQWVMKRERGGYGGWCLAVIGVINRSRYDHSAL